MGSGFTGGGDFWGSAMINNNQQQQQQQQQQQYHRSQIGYHQQIQQQQVMGGPTPTLTPSFGVKRSIAELERQQLMQQQVGFLRSVKQRSHFNHTSPISPLSPFDHFSPESRFGVQHGRFTNPFVQQVQHARSSPIIINNVNGNAVVSFSSSSPTTTTTTTTTTTSQGGPQRGGGETEAPPAPPAPVIQMRNRLQQLEKHLLDDDDDDDVVLVAVNDDDCDVSSVVTSSEWSETMQSLIITPPPTTTTTTTQQQQQQQVPFSTTSPTSSSNSSCSSTLTTSTSSSLPSSLPSCSPIQSLKDAATAISESKTDVAASILDRLKQISNARGDPEQRLISYMLSSLRSRLNPTESPPPVAELSSPEHLLATQLLYEASPCFKLGFMAANLAILDSINPQSNSIHILDFDIGQGSQYVTLIYALAEKKTPIPITLKITTIVDPAPQSHPQSEDKLGVVGDFLKKLAERVGLRVKFRVLKMNTSELSRDALCAVSGYEEQEEEEEEEEVLAVNFAFRLHKLADESVSTENPRDELLRIVKGLRPRVVTVAEQEMNCNTNTFVARVGEATGYYQAVFDSLDSVMTREGSDRVRVEECLGRKAANSVACEGRDRVERCEVFGKWRARMGMAGFQLRPLSQHVAESMRARLHSSFKNGGNSAGFTVKEENGAISFGWKGRTLTVVSAWR
ncbi:hypothetical protein Scep_006200 [Stephania cephalantha]|uniref:Scarecrow-like protein 8 n=1 Tax=Stephania cephalantha TaxID=152367 RepID=A0AAP0PJV4_9MAGN